MKALTLTQPWAQLMADGRKHIETRSWKADWIIGKTIAIHAAKGWTVADRDMAMAWGYSAFTIPRSAIVAIVRVVDIVPADQARPGLEKAFGDYSPGRWAWVTELVTKLEDPVECRGALGLWQVPSEAMFQLQVAP